MPVFIALYWMLLESVELRHAPFMFWIQDLSVKDPYFILPILMGISMFVQQMLNTTPPDPMQAKIMKMLPIIFTFFFLWFPAGLVIYWVVNNIISVAQQYFITRSIENDPSVGKGMRTKVIAPLCYSQTPAFAGVWRFRPNLLIMSAITIHSSH